MKKDTKVCPKCGKEIGKELTKIEEIEKKVKSMGTTIHAFGWFVLISNTVFYIAGMEYSDFSPSLSSLIITFSFSIVLIILGNRIESVYDKKIKKYLTICMILSILLTLMVFLTGGTMGLFALAFVVSIVSSWAKYEGFLEEEKYRSALVQKNYRIKKLGWILMIIVMVGAFLVSLNYEINNLYTDVEKSDIQEIVDFIEDSYSLPKRIDEVTIWESVSGTENAIRYNYQLSNLSGREVSEELLREHIEDGVCADTDINNLLEAGVNVEYFYTVKETRETYLVVFKKGDCI